MQGQGRITEWVMARVDKNRESDGCDLEKRHAGRRQLFRIRGAKKTDRPKTQNWIHANIMTWLLKNAGKFSGINKSLKDHCRMLGRGWRSGYFCSSYICESRSRRYWTTFSTDTYEVLMTYGSTGTRLLLNYVCSLPPGESGRCDHWLQRWQVLVLWLRRLITLLCLQA